MDYQSTTITNLAKALIQVQQNLQPALKDAENPFTKSSYATLNSVMETCREALIASGIWLCQYPVPAPEHLGGGYLGLMTKLTHAESGEWQASLAVIPLPKADPQGLGSALTYARRYALSAMLGIVTEDDDGESAKQVQRPKNRRTELVSETSKKQIFVQPHQTPPQPPCQTSPQPPHKDQQSQEHSQPPLQSPNIPKLDGVTYQTMTTQDGRTCIVAIGNTQPKKALLASAGFKWNVERKMWWKYVEVA